jgi:hypothetical protein
MAARKVWGTYKVRAFLSFCFLFKVPVRHGSEHFHAQAQAVRSKIGVTIPAGAPDVAASTLSFQGLFRPHREEAITQQVLMLVNSRCALLKSCRSPVFWSDWWLPEKEAESQCCPTPCASSGTDMGFTILDQLSGAIDDLVRQSASKVADLLLGSDLTSLVAVKQQVRATLWTGIVLSTLWRAELDTR